MAQTTTDYKPEQEGAHTVKVLLPLALAGAYDYLADEPLLPGQFVHVPLGTKDRIGVVWDAPETVEPPPDKTKLKPVLEVLDVPPLNTAARRFIDWVTRYTLAPPGTVLRMVMATPLLFKPTRMTTVYRWSGVEPVRMTPARSRVINVLKDGPPRTTREISELAAVTPGVIRGLADQGVLLVDIQPDTPPTPPQAGAVTRTGTGGRCACHSRAEPRL